MPISSRSRVNIVFTLIVVFSMSFALFVSVKSTAYATNSSSQASWSIVPSPNNGTSDNELDNVATISANNVWAVGRYASGANQLEQLEQSRVLPTAYPAQLRFHSLVSLTNHASQESIHRIQSKHFGRCKVCVGC